jgi:hypothetical protein
LEGLRRIPEGLEPWELAEYLKDLARAGGSLLEAHGQGEYLLLAGPHWMRAWSDYIAGTWDATVDPLDAPLPALGPGHEVRVQPPASHHDFDPSRECRNLVANAEAVSVAVTWFAGRSSLGGFVVRPRSRVSVRRDLKNAPPNIDRRMLPAVTVGEAVIALNGRQDWADTFDLLVHEIAHVMLGHLQGWSTLRQPGLVVADRRYVPTLPGEIEAHSVGLLVAYRRGAYSRMPREQLLKAYEAAAQKSELRYVDLLQIAAVADIITAWCAAPPDGSGVMPTRPLQPSGGSGGAVASGPRTGRRRRCLAALDDFPQPVDVVGDLSRS